MKIKWLGHSCFKIVSSKGIRIVTDPFDDNVGYPLPSVQADIVTVSHDHYDHNFVDCVKGNFDVINKVGNFMVKDIPITGIHTYHDDEQGAKRGNNIVYVFDIDGVRVCHLGDIGHTLSDAQIKMIGDVDVVLIPVGGVFTVDGAKAAEIVNELSPSIVIPMHYKTPLLKLKLESEDSFVKAMGGAEHIPSHVLEVKSESLKPHAKEVCILKYE